jgi:hypothetical protein
VKSFLQGRGEWQKSVQKVRVVRTQSRKFQRKENKEWCQALWLKPVILAAWEAEMGRIVV